MRRRSTGFRASIEFLIASAALSFKDGGYEFRSPSGAPLVRIEPRGADPAPNGQDQRTAGLDRLLEWLGAILEPVYGFKSLPTFKSKFQPRYEPLFMVCADAAALPSIARAIGRSYLPKASVRQSLSLASRMIRRPPKTAPTPRHYPRTDLNLQQPGAWRH